MNKLINQSNITGRYEADSHEDLDGIISEVLLGGQSAFSERTELSRRVPQLCRDDRRRTGSTHGDLQPNSRRRSTGKACYTCYTCNCFHLHKQTITATT